ncbi:ATP11 protein-domain-containing protein [Xylariales sp. PMI_506]|nr:ATP11 protein-domain-containing protein [Xylariales sp. PMI_506]
MAAARAPALRNLLGRPLQTLRVPVQQRRWAAVHDVRFLATTQASRNVAEKYREKLDRKAREEGHGDIGALKSAYADKIAAQRRKDSVSVPGLDALLGDEPAEATAAARSSNPAAPSDPNSTPADSAQADRANGAASKSQSKSKSGQLPIKPLWDILDLEKARELPAKELSTIWRLRHAAQPTSLSAAVPATTYAALSLAARKHPTFVLPVPREGAGAEMHYLQWVFDDERTNTATALFTQLAEYKARGEFAQPHTSITHYFDADIAASQGVVLMAGSVVEGRGATVDDAQLLVMLMQRFYCADTLGGSPTAGTKSGKTQLLEEFSSGSPDFTVERLLEETEKL